jgi:hypothetical protein
VSAGAFLHRNAEKVFSMDGRGAWRDNVFVERLWRSVKHEEIYLKAYDTVAEPPQCWHPRGHAPQRVAGLHHFAATPVTID